MGSFTITKRTDVDYKYFDLWLRENYVTYDGFFIDGTDVKLDFSDDPSSYQSAITTEHTNLTGSESSDSYKIKILSYIDENGWDSFTPPKGLNYRTGLNSRLHAKRTVVKGEVQKVEYYSDEALTDLVIVVDIVYTRDSLGFATERTTTRTWYRNDGVAHADTKITRKVYTLNIEDQIKEGKRRRKNLIDILTIQVLGLMQQTMTETAEEILALGRAFLALHKVSFQNYIDDANSQIITDMTNATDAWLGNDIGGGTTIRQFILNELQ